MKLETLNEDIMNIKDERLEKMPFVRADYGKATTYAIFRIGSKLKTIKQVRTFFKHMARLQNTPNADEERTENNIIIHGPENIYEDTKIFLDSCKINKNSVIGVELLLTVSPQFFKGMLKKDFEKWIDVNRRWLLDKFGENCRYAVLHL